MQSEFLLLLLYYTSVQSSAFIIQQTTLSNPTTGLAITPIKMPNLDEDDDDNSSAMKYLKSCKAIEYVRVD